jgi:hypothetical protein
MSEDLIKLRETELSKLIHLSVNGKYIDIHYGPGWAAVNWKTSEWVLPYLAEWRGIKA